MARLAQWLKPPRSLLTLLFLGTLAAVSALSWFGWKLLDQERIVEGQRTRESLEQSAGRVSAHAREVLAETGERLGAWALAPPADFRTDNGLLLILSGESIVSVPPSRLLYVPVLPPGSEASDDTFRDGEVLEFQQGQPDAAVEWYGHLAESKSAEIAAGALLRMARVFRKTKNADRARAAYLRLAALRGVRVAGAPAELVARHAICEMSNAKACAAALKTDLAQGRFTLTQGQFEFYWSELSRIAGDSTPAPAEASAMSDLAAVAQRTLISDPSPRGQITLWAGGQPYLAIWRGARAHRAVLAVPPDRFLKRIFTSDLAFGAADDQGRLVAGGKGSGPHTVIRTPAETELPWTLYITSRMGAAEAGLVARRHFLLLITSLTVLFLIAGAYVIARAVQRDLQISRMQSDFVSAVSHEFRSPLTAMRQLSEMLALGRVSSEDRRQMYYETLVSETTRLQRLVEGLLNFGRMEAGIRRDRFEPVDAAALIATVVDEFDAQLAGSGRRIELGGAASFCPIEADAEALTVALRNLVDNALKYSPDCQTVWVDWDTDDKHVSIRVRDNGPGIPAAEQRIIFQKFVRGSAASAANVRGSGVGLAMVRHIVAAHGGAVTVNSQTGAGSTFTVLLPAGAKSR